MSILKTFFFQIKIGSKNIKIYLTNHINLTKFAFFPMKIYVSKATSSVKTYGQNYELFFWQDRHVDDFQVTVVVVSVYHNKAVYEHEKTANRQ